MKKVVEIKVKSGDIFRFSEEEAERLSEMWGNGQATAQLPDGSMLIFNQVTAWDAVYVADYVEAQGELPAPLDLDAIKPQSEYQQRWLKLLALNAARIKTKEPHERIGLLKNLDDLDEFERTGSWPEYVPAHEWAQAKDPKQAQNYTYIKKRLTRREYDRGNYSAQPNYWFVSEEDGDMWVARVYPRIRGRKIPDGFIECTEAECDRLDYVRGVRVNVG